MLDTVGRDVGFDPATPLLGEVWIISGQTGLEAWSITGEQANDGFAAATGVIADLSGDGWDDLLASAPRLATASGPGRVYVLAGANGALVRTIDAPDTRRIGLAVAGAPDQDGDGVPDVLIEAGEVLSNGALEVYTLVFSGADGSVLADLRMPIDTALAAIATGETLVRSTDMDRDGQVDPIDVVILTDAYYAGDVQLGDVNGDGLVDILDFQQVIADLGWSADAETVLHHWLSALGRWNAIVPEDGSSMTASGAGCTGTGNGDTPGLCSVQIIECPESPLATGTAVAVVAEGAPPGGSYEWSSSGLGSISPSSGTGATFEFTTSTPGEVTIRVVYTVGDCVACAECTFEIADCSVAIIGCGLTDMLAVGTPPGGAYDWAIVGGAHLVASSYQKNPDGSGFHIDPTGEWGVIDVEVTYTVGGCVAVADCSLTVGPGAGDRDGDGVPDEIDPCPDEVDCDGDGYSDRCELLLGSDPEYDLSIPDPGRDTDLDGISDLVEVCIGFPQGPTTTLYTDHLRFDTDGDGVQDLAEFELGLNAWHPDADSNGVPDAQEPVWLDADADTDGIYDDYEQEMGWDPADDDENGDGVDDGEGLLAGSPPSGSDPGKSIGAGGPAAYKKKAEKLLAQ